MTQDPTWSEILSTLTFFDKDKLKRFVRSQLSEDWDSPAPIASALRVILADWLSQFAYFDDYQRQAIDAIAKVPLSGLAEDIATENSPFFQLFIADHRYVGCTHRQMLYDLQEAKDIEELPQFAVTFFMCDMVAAIIHTWDKIEMRRRSHGRHGETGGQNASASCGSGQPDSSQGDRQGVIPD